MPSPSSTPENLPSLHPYGTGHKLSPELQLLIEQSRLPGASLAARTVPLSAGRDPAAEPAVHVSLRCDPEADLPAVAGVPVHQRRGPVRSAIVPLGRLEEFAAQTQVRRVSAPVRLRPLLDLAGAATHLPALRSTRGWTGRNVIVGVVDTGIEAAHAMFGGASSRVLAIWDQTLPGTGAGPFPYGTLLGSGALAASLDADGHGTHVAGIAAGRLGTCEGPACDAQIIAVKTGFSSTEIQDGVDFIFQEAARLGRPAVVNLSLGGHGDPHDGSDDLDVFIDSVSGPGRIVCCAAGNEGTDPIHAEVAVAGGGTASIPVVVPRRAGSPPPAWLVINAWYEGAATLAVAVEDPAGGRSPWQPVLAVPPTVRRYTLGKDDVRIFTGPAAANPNGDHQILIEISPATTSPRITGGAWTVHLRHAGGSAATCHAWLLLPPAATSANAGFSPPAARASCLVGSPGAAGSAITVGAYTTRNAWTDASGAAQALPFVLHDVADFSSPGPLRHGAAKPDLVAPGAMIASARSSAATFGPQYRISADLAVLPGTSMATPYIAGLVACLLEGNPALDPAAAKALLTSHSLIPGRPAGAFDPKWGHGLVDAAGL